MAGTGVPASPALAGEGGWAAEAAVRSALVAERGGDDDVVAAPRDRGAGELFIVERPVHVGGVEHGDAEVEGAVDGGDGLGVVARPVEVVHPHAAKAECGRGQSLSEVSLLHADEPSSS